MILKLQVFVFIFFSFTKADIQDVRPWATLPQGVVVGGIAKSYSGKTYYKFLGIPYAQPPVGDLRFKEPQPLKKWKGTWVANFTVECAQWTHSINGGSFAGQEDCLYLNIFVPEVSLLQELPKRDVIVHIHGGGLNWGSSTTYAGPKHLMDKDVVFVTFNYRLGPLGFLSTEDDVLPGNNGMKDQSAALKWIKENIKYFGGNPDSITLTGLSAGGASVHFHYLSPLSTGLFNRGISLSGSALCNWPLQENALIQTQQLATALGCFDNSTQEIVECLRQRSAVQICESIHIFRPWLYNPYSVFGIVVEKHGNNPFLSEHPYELLAKGKIQDLPWITSIVAHEGLYPVAEFLSQEKHLSKLEKDWDDLASHILHYEHTVDNNLKPSIAKKIKKFYFKDRPISSQTNQELIQVASDRLFVVDAEKSARLQARANKSPTYFYYFTYESETAHSFVDVMGIEFKKRPGVSHGDDLTIIFDCVKIPLRQLSERDFNMREILLQMWTSFARTGKPLINGVEWKPVSGNRTLDYLHIISPEQLVMNVTEEFGNRHFWDSIKFQENEQLFPEFSPNHQL